MASLDSIRAKIEAGDRQEALNDIVGVVRLEPQNIDAWLLMAALVEEPERKRECYRRVLVVDPDHLGARLGLAELGGEESISTPPEIEPESEEEDLPPGSGLRKPSAQILRIAGWGGAGLLVILIGWLIWGGKANQANMPVIPTSRPATGQQVAITATPQPVPSMTQQAVQTETLLAQTTTPQPELVATEEVTIYFAQDAGLWCRQGATETPLRTFEFDIRQAAFSPDGRQTALTADQALWLVNCAEGVVHSVVETRQIRPLVEDPAFEGSRHYPRYLAWSPDNAFIYFDTIQTSDMGSYVADDLYRIELNTSEVTQILRYGEGGQPYVSPDGSKVAAAGARSITLANADGSGAVKTLAYGEQPPAVWETDAPPVVWLTDSSAFITAVSMEDPQSNTFGKAFTVFRVSAADGRTQALGRFASQGGGLHFSPDGRYLVVQELAGEELAQFGRLSLVELGKEEENPIAGGERVQFVAWLPDSSGYLYALEESFQLYLGGITYETAGLAIEGGPLPQPFKKLAWLDDRHFLLVTGLGLYGGEVGGPLQVLAAGDPGNSRLLAAGFR